MPTAAWILTVAFFLVPLNNAAANPNANKQTPVFEDHIAPILRVYCWSCHGDRSLAGDLDLRNLPLILKGGKHGPAITPGKPEQSLLYRKIVQGKMPPDKPIEENVVFSAVKPTAEHKKLIRRWIETGAKARYVRTQFNQEEQPPLSDDDRSWWAFRPPTRPKIPLEMSIRRNARIRTPVDAFLQRKLAEKDLAFSPDADRQALLRRLYLDLIGLPPTPQMVRDFLADPDPQAYEKQVDKLLAHSGFGQRWGRHWLDAAGYVDVGGRDNDAATINLSPGRWRYRDYVIAALNADLPYDQFLIQQLAGDEQVDWRGAQTYTPEILQSLVATGFLRLAADSTDAKELNTGDIRNQVLLDTVQLVASNLMGVTLHCAQCHSHKFDPISQADYYRLAALLAPALNRQKWKGPKQRHLWNVSARRKQAIDQHNAKLDQRAKAEQDKISQLRRSFRDKVLKAKFDKLPEPIRADVRNAINTPAEKRSAVQKYLADKLGSAVKVTEQEVEGALDTAARQKRDQSKRRTAQLEADKQSYQPIQAIWEFAPPPRFHLFRRGNYQSPGPQVQPGFIAVIDQNMKVESRQIFADPLSAPSSGYRTALARWLSRPNHPLTARVFVNRVWQHYFGRGLVETPDNFGVSGAQPTHPQLLDWLAAEFVQSAWSIKHLHRRIVTSTAYRQSSTHPHAEHPGWRKDPGNRLLWRMPLRRLKSEIIRDRVLAVSGALKHRIGGSPTPLKPQPDGSVVIDGEKLSDKTDQYRRSVYLVARRNYHLTQLSVFDQPVMAHNCTRRNSSAVVLQSLNMLNSRFMIEQAELTSERVFAECGQAGERKGAQPKNDALAGCAFSYVLSRQPDEEELAWCLEFLNDQTQIYLQVPDVKPLDARRSALKELCLILLNSNEFLYVH